MESNVAATGQQGTGDYKKKGNYNINPTQVYLGSCIT